MLGLSGSGLGMESSESVARFREQTGVTFPLLLDDISYQEYASGGGKLSPYPLDVVVDRDGIVRALQREVDIDALDAKIAELVGAGE